ncbi:MAG: hypothetical protein ACKVY0_17405 [Prosthecobacter sp.]|uniref:hypothetical protein n=1 Tax=Prosthecobacter sp. TaxID=1965333 RepID=UPI0038FD9A39
MFLDANILFSATTPGGFIRDLVRWIITFAEGVTNEYALGEARKNLGMRQPGRLQDLELLGKELHIINHTVPPPDVDLRAKDIPILVGAIAAKCTHLLTQDQRDFGPFFGHTIQSVLITSPNRFLWEIRQSEKEQFEAIQREAASKLTQKLKDAAFDEIRALDAPPLPGDEMPEASL